MYYVYILQSENDGSRYIGVSIDLKRRIQEYNNGGTDYSKSKRPYKIIWYSAFYEKKRAYDFEKYLKSSSGYAFTKKTFNINTQNIHEKINLHI
ncbi:MAG: GIY-YIG nuclease family protein [Candidatus Colwellbacteria bacterium]|nr:GIY-YIG nuclease family protein [Candidatus Colwellbacteria bacterium]